MRHEIKLIKFSEDMEEGVIVTSAKAVGDAVEKDELLFEVVAGKLNGEITSPVAGVVIEILFKEGAIVKVDDVMAVVEE